MTKTNRLVPLHRLDGELVRRTAHIVDTSGVIDMIEDWRVADGYDANKGGRPRIVPLRAALIIMLALGIQNSPQHVTRGRDILCEQTTPKAWELLGLNTDLYDFRNDDKEHQRWYSRLWESVHTILDVVDPFPELSYTTRYTLDEYKEIEAGRDLKMVMVRKARAKAFANALIMASTQMLGKKNLDQWDGSVVVDGTPLPVSTRGRGKTHAAPTPTAGWYTRRGDHKANDDDPDKVFWAFEASLAAMVGDKFGGEGKFPSLITGMSLDVPGADPSGNALDALDHLIHDPNAPKGYFIGDRVYLPQAKAERLQIPLRKAGYSLVDDLKKDSHGIKANYQGAVQVDGQWYCPVLEKLGGLVDPATALSNGEISQEDFDRIIKARKAYALKLKEKGKDGSHKMVCPARGGAPTVSCPLVNNPKGHGKALLGIPKSLVPKPQERGCICTNKSSLTIPVEAGAKYASVQGLPWKSPEWEAVYQPPRSTIESRNDLLKSARNNGLGDSTARLMRGWAAQLFHIALGVVGVNVTLISRWLRKGDNGDGWTDPTPPPDPTALEDLSLRELADVNAPPMAA